LVIDKPSMTSGASGIGAINKPGGVANTPKSNEVGKPASAFGDLLSQEIGKAKTPGAKPEVKYDGLKFSQHALERMAHRGISIKPEEMTKLNEAVEKASSKGSRETLVLMGDTALIVSVKNKTVVTAMDREMMRENVFTNIDSTVIL
jgi:flagellar operon protein